MHCKWPHELDADWPRFCRLLAVGRLPHWKYCWFWLFHRDFHFLDNQGHPNRSPQKVRDKGGLWTGRFWPTPIHTSWKLPPLAKTCVYLDWHATVVSISGTGTAADRNGPFSVVSYGHNFFSSEYEFPENLFTIECQHQTDGFFPQKVSSFSTFASVEQVQDWAAIFVRRLDCLNVEKRVNNFKRV